MPSINPAATSEYFGEKNVEKKKKKGIRGR
jgi:hypothetical protein